MTSSLTVRIDDGLKKELESLAKQEERPMSYLVVQAIRSMIDQRSALVEAIDASVKEEAQGEFISEQAMNDWVNSWGGDDELPEPSVDIKR